MKKKTIWVFLCQKYGKFQSVLLELFFEHKPPNCEECDTYSIISTSSSIIDMAPNFQILYHKVILKYNFFTIIVISRSLGHISFLRMHLSLRKYMESKPHAPPSLSHSFWCKTKLRVFPDKSSVMIL